MWDNEGGTAGNGAQNDVTVWAVFALALLEDCLKYNSLETYVSFLKEVDVGFKGIPVREAGVGPFYGITLNLNPATWAFLKINM